MAPKKEILNVDGREIAISNLDKVFFRGGHFRKADLIDYYIRISEYLLPHLKDRPVTLKRFPNGIYGQFFYEKDAPAFTPEWVRTFPVPRSDPRQPDIRYILINDLPTLIWLANLANIEIHPFLHRAPKLMRPTSLVFDLDPGEGADILSCARVASILRDLFTELKLKSLPKVSGSKGLQIYVPLNTANTYSETQPFARAIAGLLAQREPKLIVADMAKSLRTKKVFIDWSQNALHKTTVSVYSLRAKSHRPYVSVPVSWSELERARKNGDPDSLYFDPPAALERVERVGDLFAPLLKIKQALPVPPRVKTIGKPLSTGTKSHSQRSLRASRQGGRRRFLIQKSGDRVRGYELLLETQGDWRVWLLSRRPDAADLKELKGRVLETRPLNAVDFKKVTAGVNKAWDFGTYDLMEGSFETGFARLFLAGEKFSGELTTKAAGAGNTWLFTPTD